ncbi:hypothetical protein [Leptospira sp. GIMC2001]|uniref:hypothetical protein n=1 Tax=Leptospira sp. GIMC2001 TaxID=1513297 RepID=UPI00234B4951|nr:hypothetical protein [Leptospira sp. GIMC2001]WCL47679.1 hypothetical protein O4O04_00035 [Leptospira sp. GIMC2001]
MKKRFPILSTVVFLITISFLILWKISQYDWNLSALIGIWSGFAQLNPLYIPDEFILFKEGGYDGQFFFLIARYIYEGSSLPFPTLDSFYFRFHRLGLSIIAGITIPFFGARSYPYSSLFILTSLHIISSCILYKITSRIKPSEDSNKANIKKLEFKADRLNFLSLFYFLSPFSLLGILLLVSDPLLVSLSIIATYLVLFERLQIMERKVHSRNNKQIDYYFIFGVIIFCFALTVRETALFIITPLLLFFIIEKNFKKTLYLFIPIITYICFLLWSQSLEVPFAGTLPLRFLDMIDYPLFGFVKSLEFTDPISVKQIARESIKFFLFAIYLQLIANAWNIFQYTSKSRVYLALLLLPVAGTLGVITIGEQGYWRSFDNLARMFTMTVPIVIIAKAYFPNYKDFGFLYSCGILFLFLIVRVVLITQPMKYVIHYSL